MSYHFELVSKDLLCGYQINKIKHDFEDFLEKLKAVGAELVFVFKKIVSEDKEFLKRRLRDYHISCNVIDDITHASSFEQLVKIYKRGENFPYNTLILVAIIQSAEKFGNIHGCNIIKGKPAIQQVQLVKDQHIDFILGLDTFYFLFPGNFKVWSDSRLSMSEMKVQQLDPRVIVDHLKLSQENAPLFACLVGDLQSTPEVNNKVLNHFGKNLFTGAAKFINRLISKTAEEKMQEAIKLIFGGCPEYQILEDFYSSIKSFEIVDPPQVLIEHDLVEVLQNEFVSFAEEIIYNTPIFINPVFSDLRKEDTKSLKELVLPPIQKTCGILLAHEEDLETRHVVMMEKHDGKFVKVPIKIIKPPFEVPSMQIVLSGGLSSYEKMDILFWILDLKCNTHDLVIIPQEYVGDCVILLFLIKNKSLNIIDARCILKTLVDTRRSAIPLKVSTEYPEKVNERAFRCGFLFTKMYFIIHSCLCSIGLKYLCPEVQFDGVFFQKMYALNVLEEENSNEAPADQHLLGTDVLIDIFANVIRM